MNIASRWPTTELQMMSSKIHFFSAEPSPMQPNISTALSLTVIACAVTIKPCSVLNYQESSSANISFLHKMSQKVGFSNQKRTYIPAYSELGTRLNCLPNHFPTVALTLKLSVFSQTKDDWNGPFYPCKLEKFKRCVFRLHSLKNCCTSLVTFRCVIKWKSCAWLQSI